MERTWLRSSSVLWLKDFLLQPRLLLHQLVYTACNCFDWQRQGNGNWRGWLPVVCMSLSVKCRKLNRVRGARLNPRTCTAVFLSTALYLGSRVPALSYPSLNCAVLYCRPFLCFLPVFALSSRLHFHGVCFVAKWSKMMRSSRCMRFGDNGSNARDSSKSGCMLWWCRWWWESES